jgi:DNA gyrase subunit A
MNDEHTMNDDGMLDEHSDDSSIGRNDIPANIEELMHNAYLQYSLSVNVGRAIPDVRDGLKPGMRRILYAMRQLGLTKGHAYTKCAKVVGEVIGNYHPHGDQAVYDTLVRMAQDFSMRAPLVDGQGNFGSIDGDSPAAYRYTECRMERLAEELLADLDKETVDMMPNFDESTNEPIVLPARFPNLLVNGSTGIGVGMATNIPPHNLGEVIDATVMLIDDPMATVEQIMQVMPGPDFPTGGEIHGINPIIELYETGRAVLRVRGKADIEEKNGKERIIVTEIPYAVNKEQLVKRIADLVNEKRISGISGLTDESSSRTGIRIVIDVKRNAMGSVVLNQIYKHTLLETSFGAHFLVVDRNRPRIMSLRQLLQAYIDHRLEVVTRRTRYELAKAEERAHILEGLLIAVDNIDEVVAIIRASRTRDDAADALSERFSLSKRQTSAILDMRLHQLTGLAIEDLQAEYDELQRQIAYYKELLASRDRRMAIVKDELLEVREKYGDARRTEIKAGERELNIEDLIAQSVWVVTISAEGYIKRVPEETYRTQNRGGVGVMGMQTKDEDYVEHLFTAKTHDYLLFFTNKGQMHWLKTYEIPEGARVGRGRALVNLIEFEEGEFVRAIIAVPEVDDPERFIVMATANGIVKKTALDAFKHLRHRGIKAIVLDDDDDLIAAKLTDGEQEVLLSSEAGMACRFAESDVRAQGRATRGVRGMELRDDDGNLTTHIVSMSIVNPEADLLVITVKGMGKRTHLGSGVAELDKDLLGGYRLTRRAGKGVISIRLREDDRVVAAIQLEEEEDILLGSVHGQLVRISSEDIRPMGRNSQGVRIMRLREGDEISSVSIVSKLDEEELAKQNDQQNDEQNGEENGEENSGNQLDENSETTADGNDDEQKTADDQDSETLETDDDEDLDDHQEDEDER